MNTIESVSIIGPDSKNAECAKLTITDTSQCFLMPGLMTTQRIYTLSFWVKASVAASLGTNGDTFIVDGAWQRCVTTFTADTPDAYFSFGAAGTYYIYHAQLEIGSEATDWRPATEDMATVESLGVFATKSEVTQTAESIRAEITELQNGVETRFAEVELELNSFRVSLSETQTSITEQLAQTERNVADHLAEQDAGVDAKLTETEKTVTEKTASLELEIVGLRTTISETETRLAGDIETQSERITEFGVTLEGVSSRVEQNAEGISGLDTKYTTMEQTVEGFEGRVVNVETGLDKTLSFNENGLVVRTSDGSEVQIDGGQINAENLNLTGHIAIGDFDDDLAAQFAGISDTANSALSAAGTAQSDADYAWAVAYGLANGTYSGTFIDKKSIASPNIIGGTITGVDIHGATYHDLQGLGTLELNVENTLPGLWYTSSLSGTLFAAWESTGGECNIQLPGGTAWACAESYKFNGFSEPVVNAYGKHIFWHDVDFSNANVTGITAVFA